MLNAVAVPAGADDAKGRKQLLEEFGIEIGGGLGALKGKAWRIGLMGHSCNRRNVLLCLTALEDVLGRMGAPIERGMAVPAAV